MSDTDTETENESEAYEPWPGCVMSRTGNHFKETYLQKRRATTIPAKKLLGFLHLPLDGAYSLATLENAIIARARSIEGRMKSAREFEFDGTLWEALEHPRNARLRFHHLAACLEALWQDNKMRMEPEK